MANTMSYIYILVDPRTRQPRYVGKTSKTLEGRLREHIRRARKEESNHHRDCWIRQLIADGVIPEIEAIECGLWSVDHTNFREKYWIANLKQIGAKLTNMTAGGDGGGPVVVTEEHRRKLGAASKRNWTLEEYRTNLEKKYAEYWATNTRAHAAVSRQVRERWADPEYSARKTLQSDDYRARRSEIAKNIASTPEGLARLRALGSSSMKIRRSCNECEYVGAPMHVGSHQKRTKHSGHTDLNGGEE